MYIENSRGPRTDPCSTPYFTVVMQIKSCNVVNIVMHYF